ncbi:hypothetical protein PR048_003309 [Dryococelus australis]|uniref:PiggyBac transposable element-derived protein domain-containing protein n=1 Tax=Dryococelus australis TaxID=614101 RepID=A0ABQ9INN2_9NEOP|nr:hypothetical protein PR048_003309 [Dryococelus australis]
MKFIRFDLKDQRPARLAKHKFALVSEVWDSFIKNCSLSYVLGANITVDEQLFPTKARCKFTQYMVNNKPDKFGIKFWLAADVDTKYFLNGFPYLGKDDNRPPNQSLQENVVMNLMAPYLGKGRNVTTDNFFTSVSLTEKLKIQSTSLGKSHNQSIFQKQCHFIMQPSMESYLLDQMARKYSEKAASRRWPLQVFYNILDLAGINTWVLFKQITGKKISRRVFLQMLSLE